MQRRDTLNGGIKDLYLTLRNSRLSTSTRLVAERTTLSEGPRQVSTLRDWKGKSVLEKHVFGKKKRESIRGKEPSPVLGITYSKITKGEGKKSVAPGKGQCWGEEDLGEIARKRGDASMASRLLKQLTFYNGKAAPKKKEPKERHIAQGNY